MNEKIELGDRVQDRISKEKGIVVAICDWLYGCKRISVQPEKKGTDKTDSLTFDEPQLKLLKKRVVKTPHNNPKKQAKERRHGNRDDITREALQ